MRIHGVILSKPEGQNDETDAAHIGNASYLRNVLRVCQGKWKDFMLKSELVSVT